MNLERRLQELRQAARLLRALPSPVKNRVLKLAAKKIEEGAEQIILANQRDLQALPSKASPAFRDRLLLNHERLSQMAKSLRQVARLPDPVGECVEQGCLQNGMQFSRVRSPLGVILMIFESRPNVAVEAFSLGFKAGNAMILRGGKESCHTTEALYQVLTQALRQGGAPENCLLGISDPHRQWVKKLLACTESIDVVVPRGGPGLIRFVSENTKIPLIKNDRGLCHVYVHQDADLQMAAQIVENAKIQRPGVCNSMETLLVHQSVAERFLPALAARLASFALEWRACPTTRKILKNEARIKKAKKSDWATEHLDLILNCRVVPSYEEAVKHIECFGSRHSEAIVSRSRKTARRFESEVDAAAVYWNASTRFTDGFELGLGGELGISTQKLHVRGPVGLRELTSVRWIIEGKGQVRK